MVSPTRPGLGGVSADSFFRVSQYRDRELFPSGYWTYQSFGNSGGVQSMVARKDNVEQDDIVIWSTYGLTHNPRVEDCTF